MLTSPIKIKITPISIYRKTQTVICYNLIALKPRCTRSSFLLIPHYMCPHRSSDNQHNAISILYCDFRQVMPDEPFVVVLRQMQYRQYNMSTNNYMHSTEHNKCCNANVNKPINLLIISMTQHEHMSSLV